MSARSDIGGFMYPAIDPRVDVTDHYVFQNRDRPENTILITNVNPLAPVHANEFRPDAVYETLIDTDGDAKPDVSVRCRFTQKIDGRQYAHVTRASLVVELEDGHIHEELETDTLVECAPVSFRTEPHVTEEASSGVRFFAGLRSDPMFFDVVAYADRMRFRAPGSDFFAGKNVFSIALEVPNELLGDSPKIGVWTRTLLPMVMQRDHFTQFDQAGRPLIGALFTNGNDQTLFNQTEPANQRATRNASGRTFLEQFTTVLEKAGNVPTSKAKEVAEALLPDILECDRSRPSGFPNGRCLHDDVADHMLGMLTNGAITTDHVGPHADYLAEFPYVGHPSPVVSAGTFAEVAASGRPR